MKVSKIEELEALRERLASCLSEISDEANVYDDAMSQMIDAVEEIDRRLKANSRTLSVMKLHFRN